MFNNLFGKKENKTQPEVAVAEKSNYPSVVHEIHNEFLTAGDKILGEATCLLKQLEEKDVAKGKRLAAIGFNKTREAVAAIETENKLVTTKEIAELVEYYRMNYPNNKFITESQVKIICEKYGLVCGETSMYKGFVPENKLAIIEKFKLKEKDSSNLISDNGLCFENAEIRKYGGYWHIFKKTEKDRWNYSFQSNDGKTFYSRDSKDIFGFLKLGDQRFEIVSSSLSICAPVKDMEIPPNRKLVGYKIQHIPDPVVLQPVKGGYLVVCAWGDEASDPVVVNEINN